MFNSHTYVKMVTNQVNNMSFQQVSGSLLKSHADSIFVRFDKGSQLEKEIFSNQPTMNVRVGWEKNCGYYTNEYKPKMAQREVTVLQVLLAHNSSYVCEVVVHYQKGDEQYTKEGEESNNHKKIHKEVNKYNSYITDDYNNYNDKDNDDDEDSDDEDDYEDDD